MSDLICVLIINTLKCNVVYVGLVECHGVVALPLLTLGHILIFTASRAQHVPN